MRTPGGKALSNSDWQALMKTQVQPGDAPNPEHYHSCYCWSVTTMAAFMLSRMSAAKANQVLYIMPAIDQPQTVGQPTKDLLLKLLQVPSMSRTKRLPGLCCFHVQQKVRFTANVAPPFATQDTEGTVVGFDPDPRDVSAYMSLGQNLYPTGEVQLQYMPTAVYVRIDDCTEQFLPPCPCAVHVSDGCHPDCSDCSANAAQPGVYSLEPISRTWYYYPHGYNGEYMKVNRRQLALMPLKSVGLYSMQGTTADPGLTAYWEFGAFCDESLQWLIVYVMLSRCRSLATLRSVSLSPKIRDIIETGPPEAYVGNFEKLFGKKIVYTKLLAENAAQQYKFLPENFL